MKAALLITLSLLFHNAFGQKMYLDSMYAKVLVTTHQFKTKDGQSLGLDYYRAEGASGNLPLVIYVHGGGFSSGSRDSQGIQYFAKRLAKRGYAVVSVSYRLTMKDVGFECDITDDQKLEAIANASLDVVNGIKYIMENKTVFLVDEENVILAGSSAGAETVLNLAYGYDYNSIVPNFSFAGVISLSGSLTSLDGVTKGRAIPTQFFHGTEDEFIPYETGPHRQCHRRDPGYLIMHGAGAISEKLKDMGKPYYLYTIDGGTHSWAGIPTKRCFTEIVDFLYNDVLYPNVIRQTERTIFEK